MLALLVDIRKPPGGAKIRRVNFVQLVPTLLQLPPTHLPIAKLVWQESTTTTLERMISIFVKIAQRVINNHKMAKHFVCRVPQEVTAIQLAVACVKNVQSEDLLTILRETLPVMYVPKGATNLYKVRYPFVLCRLIC